MILTNVIIDPDSKIDFFAGSMNALEKLEPFYNALAKERQGVFYVPISLAFDATNTIPKVRISNKLDGYNPLVICNYKDLNTVFYTGEERPFIIIEDGYTMDSRGLLKLVALSLCNDKRTYNIRRSTNENVILFDTVETAISGMLAYIKGREVKHIKEIDGYSIGIMYMAFGDKAMNAVRKSIASLKRLGYSYPVSIASDISYSVNGYNFIHWDRYSPFDTKQRNNFQFRAGRIKPYLYDLSPYDYTLYIDADTQFLKPIQEGFEYLTDYDICLTEERLSLKQLYNKKMAGWEINLLERDTTMIELDDIQGENKFINSGVMFFRKSKSNKQLFSNWYKEWMRFQEWDEQLALMRAIRLSKSKVKYLSYEWNNPHPEETSYIFHNYGRGAVRENR